MRYRLLTDLHPGLRLLVVGELELARDLYRDVLGLPVLRERARGLLLGAGSPPVPVLTLCPADPSGLDGTHRLVQGLIAAQGGAWAQLWTTDVDATLARLRAHGAATLRLGHVRADGRRVGAAADPWGNTLRLVQTAAMNPADPGCPTS